MLTREIMGVLALGVLWVNAALVWVVAVKQLSNVLALRRRFRDAAARGELVRGTVRGSGALAVRRVAQLGRAMTTRGPDRILFTDGAQSFEVLGGEVEAASGPIEIAAAGAARSDVWASEARQQDATACASADEFDRAFAEASRFKGFAREVCIDVRGGDPVWVLGVRREERVEPPEDAPLLVSMVDPLAYCASRARLLLAFLALAAFALFGVTALALWPPYFGTVSTVGGALAVAYFLGIQPIGTAVRDAVKTPGRRAVGALWQRPATAAPALSSDPKL